MSVNVVASNALAQAAAVDQAVESETVVVSKTGSDADLARTERLLISRNNSPRNTRAPSMT